MLFSILYIFFVRPQESIALAPLPPYPPAADRDRLLLVVGELHHPKCPQPVEKLQWLMIPDRGLLLVLQYSEPSAPQAYVDRATAYLALGDEQRAVEAYERALARERKFPNVRTQAVIEPFLIATRRMREPYDTALDLVRQSSKDVLWPVTVFKQQATIALISAHLGNQQAPRDHAARAIEAAAAQNSGFRYHPTLGLVGSKFDDVRASLMGILNW